MVKFHEIVFPTFIYFHESYRNSANIRQHLTVFPSYFNNIFLKYFGILQNLMRNYDILWKFMKVDESYDIPWYFFGQITYFHSVSSNCDVLLAFHNFVLWWMKFFCLLSYRFTSRQYWQIFCHCQTKGDISNIADTYLTLFKFVAGHIIFLSCLLPKQISPVGHPWWPPAAICVALQRPEEDLREAVQHSVFEGHNPG